MEWAKNKERNQQIREFRQLGLSIGAISKKLNCSKSTVSFYSKPIELSDMQKVALKENDLKNKFSKNHKVKNINSEFWESERNAVIAEANKEWLQCKINPMTMLFLGLYWGEGTKSFKTSQISIVNNDPGVLKIAFNFIKQFSSKKVTVNVKCYPDIDLLEAKKYWELIFGYTTKVKHRKENGKGRKPTSKYGTCSISVSDWKLRYKIITWLDLLRKESIGNINSSHITGFHKHYTRSVA